ncbi:hypothetical protein PsorP6_007064 [Peronosclerospora sorghi]|uniref:Uncharacterized protein n=1 Tax=Peronosclerospora sorghi TaxID=230839 RepID=A0ACC0W8Y8_9STRA|nr:hypothetical protein PsorP6_007064 [Peronosclerospora sorghi]
MDAPDVTANFPQMIKAKEKAVWTLTAGIESLFKKNKVTFIRGFGKLSAQGEVSVALNDNKGNETVRAKNIIIVTGSQVTPLPPVPVDIEAGKIVDSTGALSLTRVSIWNQNHGVRSHRGPCHAHDRAFEGGGAESTITCDTVLVATGRRAFTAGLGLEQMSIQTDKLGRIKVNEAFRTQVPGIFAIGDVIKSAMLAYKAEEEGIACVENIAGKHGHVNDNAIFPTEEELKAQGVAYNVGKFPMMANSRARTVAKADGLVKVLANKHSDKLLGVHIIASNVGEMISEGVIGIEYGAASEDLARTCHAHPTLSEALACLAAFDKPINFETARA